MSSSIETSANEPKYKLISFSLLPRLKIFKYSQRKKIKVEEVDKAVELPDFCNTRHH